MSCLIERFVSPVEKIEETRLKPDLEAYIPLGKWLGYPISLRRSPGRMACAMSVFSFFAAAAVPTSFFYVIPTALNTTTTSAFVLGFDVVITAFASPAFTCFGVINLANGLLARGNKTGEYEYQ